MATATVERVRAGEGLQAADCSACLTRNCPLSGSADSPVTVCTEFRTANCAFCVNEDCPLNGQLETPVMSCSGFQVIGAAK